MLDDGTEVHAGQCSMTIEILSSNLNPPLNSFSPIWPQNLYSDPVYQHRSMLFHGGGVGTELHARL